MQDHQTTVADVIEDLGRSEMRARLGVTDHSIKAARAAGVFPAAWYSVVSAMCAERGVRCSHSLFRFRENAQ